MAGKKNDLGGLQLKRHRESTDEQSAPSVVSAVRAGGDPRVRRLPLDSVADNPENPEARAGDVTELAASMRQVGQLQPGLVVTARAFLEAHPEHTDTIGDRAWVLLAGHRRKAAAREAGLEVLEVLERDGERMDEAVLHENMHRLALSPIEEAESFQRVMQRNDLSQRQMAEHAGISQSYLAKRLHLLKLPETLRRAVDAGVVAPSVGVAIVRENEAEVLTELEAVLTKTEPDLTQSWAVTSAVREASATVRRRQALLAAQEKARTEGVTVVEDPDATFGAWKLGDHRLRDEAQIEQARAAGDLAYAPEINGTREPVPVRLSAPSETTPVANTYEQQRKEADKERKASNEARRAFLVELVKKMPGAKERTAITTLATLRGAHLGSQVTSAARRIAQAAGVGPDADNDWDWRVSLLDQPSGIREHLAWIVALAALEDELRWANVSTWSTAALELVTYMTERGYTLTEHEERMVAKSTHTKEHDA